MRVMWNGLAAVLIGLLVGGGAYLVAGPGDGTNTSLGPAEVPAAGVTTVELQKPSGSRKDKQGRDRSRSQVAIEQVAQVNDAPHQLVDSSPGEQQGTGGAGSHSPPPGKTPRRSAHRPIEQSGDRSADDESDDEDESGDSDSQGNESHDSGSGDSERGDSNAGD
jgi:hypothetical protein